MRPRPARERASANGWPKDLSGPYGVAREQGERLAQCVAVRKVEVRRAGEGLQPDISASRVLTKEPAIRAGTCLSDPEGIASLCPTRR
jgi:hypothetical protein